MTKKKYFYVLEATSEGCDVEALLNEVPVGRVGPSHGRFLGGAFNELVVDGVNHVTLVVRPGKTPSQSTDGTGGDKERLQPEDERASVKLSRYPMGAVVGGPDGKELLSVDWVPPVDGDGNRLEQDFPLVRNAQADLGPMFGEWSWQVADRVSLAPKELAEILPVVREVHASLQRGEPDVFLQQSALRTREMERAYDCTFEDDEQNLRDDLARDSAEEWFGMQPIHESSLDFRLCGGNRIVHCVNRDWKATVRQQTAPDGETKYYEMLVSRINGRWQIVR